MDQVAALVSSKVNWLVPIKSTFLINLIKIEANCFNQGFVSIGRHYLAKEPQEMSERADIYRIDQDKEGWVDMW